MPFVYTEHVKEKSSMEIFFATAHGKYKLNYLSLSQTLQEVCLLNRIPFQSVSFYGLSASSSAILVGLHQTLEQFFKEFDSILIRPDRNIDYEAVCMKNVNKVKCSNPVAEYTFPQQENNELIHCEFNEKECVKYVEKAVGQFLRNEVVIDPNRKIVVGISGGGDSNTIIGAFLNSGMVSKEQIVPVMMMGIPDWDKGKPRAEAICKNYEIELQIVTPEQVNILLGRSGTGDWVEDFEKCFPDADLEVLGTLGIRLSLTHIANKLNAQAIVTGLNLEDILGECLLLLVQGKLSKPFPVRTIDGMPLWYPLYNIPKKILDGCHPKFSLENYNDRYPSKMTGRALAYYLAQSMHSSIPGIEFDLLNGFRKLSEKNDNYCFYDKDIGFSCSEEISDELKSQWNMFRQI